jgi:hypothetical protein
MYSHLYIKNWLEGLDVGSFIKKALIVLYGEKQCPPQATLVKYTFQLKIDNINKMTTVF